MKKFLSAFLALFMILAVVPSELFSITAKAIISSDVMDYYDERNGVYYDSYIDTYYDEKGVPQDVRVFIVHYIDGSGDVVVPDLGDSIEIENDVLTTEDFRGYTTDNARVNSITLPDSVTKICSYAFDGYSWVKSINLSDGVKSIGSHAFYNTGISSIYLSDTITSIGVSILDGTPFYNDDTNWENGVLYAGNHLIKARPSLSGDYTVKNGTKTIAAGAFSDCTDVTGITIPKSVVNIGSTVFSNCKNLKSITVEEGNPVYHSEGNCVIETATNTIVATCGESVIPDYVTSIAKYAFAGSAIEYLSIPDSVTEIGEYAFENSSLVRVEIPESIKEIKKYTFTKCSKLETIVLPKSLKTVADAAFSYCENIKTVYYNCTNGKANMVITNPSYTYGDGIKYNVNFRDANWISYHNIDENEGITIAPTCTESGYTNCVCSDCENIFIQEAKLPLGHDFEATGICERCDTLIWEYTVNSGEVTIINYTDCLGDIVTIPSMLGGYPVTAIGSYALADNTTLERIIIPNSVKTIENGAFKGCKNLKTVEFSNKLETIGNSAFSGCENLLFVELPEKVTSIGNSAFNGCKRLVSAYLPSKLDNLGMYAFYSCQNLAVIRFPFELETIKEYTFYNCFDLAYIEVPSNLTKIDKNAFYGVNDAFTVYLPKSRTRESISITATGNDVLDSAVWKNGLSFTYSITAPDCTYGGNVYYKSPEKTYSVSINSLGHGKTEALGKITPSTCTEKGRKHYAMSCGHERTTYGIISKGHVFPYVVAAVEPTCTQEGGVLHSCSRCGDSFNAAPIPKTDHVYEPIVTPPTCASEGYTTYKCSCGDSYTMDIVPKEDHTFNEEIITEELLPTCTNDGYIVKVCDKCGEEFKEMVSKLGHEMKYSSTVAATPSSQGYDIFVCANGCGRSEERNFTSYAPEAPTDRVSGVKVRCTDVDITLSWNGFSGAEEYYAKVYNNDFTKCIKTITTKNTNVVFDFKTLEYNTDYKFIVTAKLDGGKYLTVANATRVDGAMVIGDRVVGHKITMEGKGAIVDFLSLEGATEYLVNVFEGSAQGTRIYTATLDKNTTSVRVMNNLSAGTTYVVMINAKVNGKYMSLADLRVKGVAVSFTAPVINPTSYTIAAQTATTIRFSWDAVRGATEYFVRVKEKETGKLVNTLHTVNGKTTVALARYSDGTRISPDTTYTLEFCAYVPGVTATYGAPVDITTCSFEEINVNARASGRMFYLEWNSTTNSVSYFVYVYKNGEKIDNFYLEGTDNTSMGIYNAYGNGEFTFGVIACESNTSGTGYTPLTKSNAITV